MGARILGPRPFGEEGRKGARRLQEHVRGLNVESYRAGFRVAKREILVAITPIFRAAISQESRTQLIIDAITRLQPTGAAS